MKVVIATQNVHKLREFQALLNPLGYDVSSLQEKGYHQEIEETGHTFEENAVLKAEIIARTFDCAVIADDSGLEVEALNGFPGVESARFLGHSTPYSVKNAAIIERMKDQTNRRAYFVCALAYARPNYPTKVFSFRLPGFITKAPTGAFGFGYDPIFYVEKYQATFAELSPRIKNKISHRAQATKMLVDYLKKHL